MSDNSPQLAEALEQAYTLTDHALRLADQAEWDLARHSAAQSQVVVTALRDARAALDLARSTLAHR